MIGQRQDFNAPKCPRRRRLLRYPRDFFGESFLAAPFAGGERRHQQQAERNQLPHALSVVPESRGFAACRSGYAAFFSSRFNCLVRPLPSKSVKPVTPAMAIACKP